MTTDEFVRGYCDYRFPEKGIYREALKNWDVYGYPLDILKKMIEIAKITHPETHNFGVLDDFGLQAVSYLHFGLNVPYENITFLVSDKDNLGLVKNQFSCVPCSFYYIDNKELSNKNMIVIMNPPYGKCGRTATNIIKAILSRVDEIVCLCQPRSIEKDGVYEHVVKADIVDNIFDAGLGKLAVSRIRNDYKEGKKVLYGMREIQETDIPFQIEKFNKGRKVAIGYSHCNCNPFKYRDLVDSGRLFLFGVFDLSHHVQDPNKTHGLSVDLNFYRRKLIWAGEINKNGNDCYAYEFVSKKAKENFRDAFFDIPKVGFWSVLIKQNREYSKGMQKAESFVPAIDWEHLNESPLWETSKEKAFLVELIKEGGQRIVLAYLKARNENLDWSRSWTDEEILAELGLDRNCQIKI